MTPIVHSESDWRLTLVGFKLGSVDNALTTDTVSLVCNNIPFNSTLGVVRPSSGVTLAFANNKFEEKSTSFVDSLLIFHLI